MLSRVADSIYWMSRYIERAENVARFIDVNLNLMLDLPVGSTQQWRPLVDTTGDADARGRVALLPPWPRAGTRRQDLAHPRREVLSAAADGRRRRDDRRRYSMGGRTAVGERVRDVSQAPRPHRSRAHRRVPSPGRRVSACDPVLCHDGARIGACDFGYDARDVPERRGTAARRIVLGAGLRAHRRDHRGRIA